MLLLQLLSDVNSFGYDHANFPTDSVRSAFEVRIADFNAASSAFCIADNLTTRYNSPGQDTLIPYTHGYLGVDDTITEKTRSLWGLFFKAAGLASQDKCSSTIVSSDDSRVGEIVFEVQKKQIEELPTGLLITSGARTLLDHKFGRGPDSAYDAAALFADVSVCYDHVLVASASERVFRHAVLAVATTDSEVEYERYSSGDGELEIYFHKVAPESPNSPADCYDALHEAWALKITDGVERQIRSFDLVTAAEKGPKKPSATEEVTPRTKCGWRRQKWNCNG